MNIQRLLQADRWLGVPLCFALSVLRTLGGGAAPDGSRPPRNRVLWAGLACSPCVNAYNNRQSPCRNNRCLQVITVEQVFAETCRAFEQKRSL
jgi:hypothetical protein